MKSTMGDDLPLTVTSILRHGATWHGEREVVTAETGSVSRVSYEEIAAGAAQLAHALRSLGIDGDNQVSTYLWNNREHLEAYLAMPRPWAPSCTPPTSGCSRTSWCRPSTWPRTGCCWPTPT